MNPKLLYIREGDRLTLVRQQILKFGVTAVPILDALHKPVGLVSLRDLGDGADAVRIGAPVYSVRADATVEDGANELVKRTVHHLVVVDDNGAAVGMLSALDVLRALTGAPARHPDAFDRF